MNALYNIAIKFGDNERETLETDINCFENFTPNKVPDNVLFEIPNITPVQVSTIINTLDPSKAIGLDGLGPRVLKSICSVLSHSLAILINKSIATGCFPDQLKLAKVFLIIRVAANRTQTIIDQSLYCQLFRRFLKGMLTRI